MIEKWGVGNLTFSICYAMFISTLNSLLMCQLPSRHWFWLQGWVKKVEVEIEKNRKIHDWMKEIKRNKGNTVVCNFLVWETSRIRWFLKNETGKLWWKVQFERWCLRWQKDIPVKRFLTCLSLSFTTVW